MSAKPLKVLRTTTAVFGRGEDKKTIQLIAGELVPDGIPESIINQLKEDRFIGTKAIPAEVEPGEVTQSTSIDAILSGEDEKAQNAQKAAAAEGVADDKKAAPAAGAPKQGSSK